MFDGQGTFQKRMSQNGAFLPRNALYLFTVEYVYAAARHVTRIEVEEV